MINFKSILIYILAFNIWIAFPLSFTVENNNPLCFIERFEIGEVFLKEINFEL